MRTIKDNLDEAIRLLKMELVVNHIRACELVYLDLSAIQGFPEEVLRLMAYYQKYLLERHQSVKKVGFWKKLQGWAHSVILSFKIQRLNDKIIAGMYGDGNQYIQEISMLIRKAI